VGYYQLGFLADPVGTGVDLEHGLALALAHPLLHGLGGFVELSGIVIPDQHTESVSSMWGLGYPVRDDIVLDVAVAWKHTDEASTLTWRAGVTWNTGRVLSR
jgi:hypothetical protein